MHALCSLVPLISAKSHRIGLQTSKLIIMVIFTSKLSLPEWDSCPQTTFPHNELRERNNALTKSHLHIDNEGIKGFNLFTFVEVTLLGLNNKFQVEIF